ncbi:MAG TPA: LL-diaminopimelate aminotransferase [Azospirillum sp.]
MSDSEFHRIKRLPPYVFAEVNAMKARARAAGEDIIDLGMGNPDQPTPQHIVDKLVEAVQNPKTHRYSNSRGIPGLRRAHAAYYKRRFNVDIDPESECIVTIGSKEGLANLANAITSPGDTILVPNPSYPIHPFGFVLAGASIRHLPVGHEGGAEPDADKFMEVLERATRHSVPKPLALVLNYPSNPTAQVAGLDFYRPIVEFCRKHGIYILSDLAYAEIYFNDVPPPSILEIPEAREVAVEFTSMSKTYNMAGWRIGFASGNKKLIAALARIKSYLDYGAFTPVQVAATAALNGPQDCVEQIRQMYKQRRDVLIDGLAAAGWQVPTPPASMFAWAPIPPQFAHLGSLEFSKLLLQEACVAVSPGIGFGEYGDGHVRLGLVENVHRIRQATRNIKEFFRSNAAGAAQSKDPEARRELLESVKAKAS